MNKTQLKRWTSDDAAELYGIRTWGAGYFDVSPEGNVIVRPRAPRDDTAVNLIDVIEGLRARGLTMPMLLRFSDILDSQIAALNDGFANAMNEMGYQGAYRGVYPIKVNQQQQVIEEIVTFGQRYHHGLEAGSKAELIAALGYITDPEALLICNGYKDAEFVDLALYSRKLGVNTVLVIEMPGELDLVLERAQALRIQPVVGVRVKLTTQAGGRWSESGGERSVFGLTTTQIIRMVDRLRQCDMLDCFQLLHYHLGSQIPNIRHIRNAIAEACRFYVDLVAEGVPLSYLDVGGGLAVDYDGSHTNFPSSRNYTLSEYCADIIEAVMAVADEAGVAHPIIVSESGRAVVAYYSVLLFDVLDVTQYESADPVTELPATAHEHVHNLRSVGESLTVRNLQECFHDAMYYREEIQSLFLHGAVSLRERAFGERIFWGLMTRIAKEIPRMKYIPDELRGLDVLLSDVYHCNFSVFQSLPDSWAIEQLFPILPIHRLNEKPERQAVLADTTCDCDGKIDRFIGLHDIQQSLPVHNIRNGEDYHLGAFLVGAYQETLGDLHNMLGDTNVVTVRLDDDGDLQFSREIYGDSVADVLSYVEYEPKQLLARLRNTAERAVRAGRITARQRRDIVQAYEAGLRGYTYVEPSSTSGAGDGTDENS